MHRCRRGDGGRAAARRRGRRHRGRGRRLPARRRIATGTRGRARWRSTATTGLLYVALSTSDEVAIVDPVAGGAAAGDRAQARVRLPRRDRRDAGRRRAGGVPVRRGPAADQARRGRRLARARRWPPGRRRGARGLAVAPGGTFAYVASPAVGGVKVVSLAAGGVVQTLADRDVAARAAHRAAGTLPGRARPLLLVSNFIDHTVTVHEIARRRPAGRRDADDPDRGAGAGHGRSRGRGRASLLLFTHEDRPLDRARAGRSKGWTAASSCCRARPRAARAPAPFDDPGPGKRAFVNLGERADAGHRAGGGRERRRPRRSRSSARAATTCWSRRASRCGRGAAVVAVGANPSAVAALPGGRFVTADRLSDTLTLRRGRRGRRRRLSVGAASGRRPPSAASCCSTAARWSRTTSPTGRCRCTPAPPVTTTATSTAGGIPPSATGSSR